MQLVAVKMLTKFHIIDSDIVLTVVKNDIFREIF